MTRALNSLSCHIQFFSIVLSYHCLLCPSCFGLTVCFYLSLSIIYGYGEVLVDLFPGGAPFWGPGLYPPGALEVGVNTLVRSREGSREAGLHVGSRGIASGHVQGHMRVT